MTEQRSTLIRYLKAMGFTREDTVNLMAFMDTPQMEAEMISAMEEKNFQMTEREVWNAAGTIVKKHL